MIKDFKLFETNLVKDMEIESLFEYRKGFRNAEEMLVSMTKICSGKIVEFEAVGDEKSMEFRTNDKMPIFYKTFVMKNGYGDVRHEVYFIDGKGKEFLINVNKKIIIKTPERKYTEYDPFGEEYYEP